MLNSELLEKYKRAYEELKLILDLSFDQITIADGNGIFLKVSKSCEPCFGIKEEEMIGTSAFELEKRGIFDISVTAEVIRKKREITLIQKTRSNKTLLVTGIPVFDENGNIERIINISRDITRDQRLYEQLEILKGSLQWFRKELNKRQGIQDNNVIYKSAKMKKVIDLITLVADSDATVLLTGETGVGKGYFAKLIHRISDRRDEPFIQINCCAIPESLLESELFGYVSGAFTGATKSGKKGLFEIAGKGTIFLDEIGDMPLGLQVKLLHVLDEKKFFRIGGEKLISIECRIIAATNKNLKKMVNEGKFRKDLYYRLNVFPIEIPPLRERREDLPFLINMFLSEFNKKYGTEKVISEKGYKILVDYDYSGNIRELENLIERLVITTEGDVIDEEQIADILRPPDRSWLKDDEIIPIKEAVEQLERHILTLAFQKYKTTRKVAEALKIDQSTVVKKAKKLNIKVAN